MAHFADYLKQCSLTVFIHFRNPRATKQFGPKWPILQNCSKHVPLLFCTFSKPQGTKTFWVKMAHFTELL